MKLYCILAFAYPIVYVNGMFTAFLSINLLVYMCPPSIDQVEEEPQLYEEPVEILTTQPWFYEKIDIITTEARLHAKNWVSYEMLCKCMHINVLNTVVVCCAF